MQTLGGITKSVLCHENNKKKTNSKIILFPYFCDHELILEPKSQHVLPLFDLYSDTVQGNLKTLTAHLGLAPT